MRRFAKWFAPLCALLTLAVAWRTARRETEIARALASAKTLAAELSLKIASTEMQLAPPQKMPATEISPVIRRDESASGQPTVERAETVVQPSSTPVRSAVAAVDPRFLTARNADLRAAHLLAYAADLDMTWGPLLQQLNLPPEQLARFKALLVTNEERRLDVTALAGEKNVSLDDPTIRKLRNNDGSLFSREMRALLGPELMAIYQPYWRSIELPPVIAEIVAETYFTPEPLTLTQAQQLREILLANSDKRASGFVSADTIRWEGVIAQSTASGAFPQPVLEALRHLGTERIAEKKVAEKLDEIVERYTGSNDVPGIRLIGVPFDFTRASSATPSK